MNYSDQLISVQIKVCGVFRQKVSFCVPVGGFGDYISVHCMKGLGCVYDVHSVKG